MTNQRTRKLLLPKQKTWSIKGAYKKCSLLLTQIVWMRGMSIGFISYSYGHMAFSFNINDY